MTVDLAWSGPKNGDGGLSGDPAQPVFVALHAFPCTSALYEPVRSRLDGTCRFVAPDLRGFGGSALGDDEPSVDPMADDVAELLDRLGVERAVVGGTSLGGYVTMAFVRRHPDRLRAVVLIDTKAGADPPEGRANRLRMAAAAAEQGTAVLHPMMDLLLGATTRRSKPAVVAAVQAMMDATSPGTISWVQRAMAARPDSFDTLSRCPVPGAVVVGEEDAISPHAEALAMAAAFATPAPVHVIPAAGHLSPLEAPDETAAALRDVLGHLG